MKWLIIVAGLFLVLLGIKTLLSRAKMRRMIEAEEQVEREVEQAERAERRMFESIVYGVTERFDFAQIWHADRLAEFEKFVEQCEVSVGDQEGTRVFDPIEVFKIVRQTFTVPYDSSPAWWQDVALSILLNENHGHLFGLDKRYDRSDPDKWVRRALEKHDSSLILLPSENASRNVGEHRADVQPESWFEVGLAEIDAAWFRIPQYIRYEYFQTWCLELLKRVAIVNARIALWQELEVAGIDLPDEQFLKYQRFCRECWRFYVHEDEHFEEDPIERQNAIRDRHRALSAVFGQLWTGWHWTIFPEIPDSRITEPYWETVKDQWFTYNEQAKKDLEAGLDGAKPLPEPEGTEYVSYYYKVNFGTPCLQIRLQHEDPQIGEVYSFETVEDDFVQVPKPKRREPRRVVNDDDWGSSSDDDDYSNGFPEYPRTHTNSGASQ